MALTRLLTVVSKIRTDAVVEKLQEAMTVSNKLKGQEKRDAILGRLFGYLAIIRSGRLSSHTVRCGACMALRPWLMFCAS